jgi:hypothetical protein
MELCVVVFGALLVFVALAEEFSAPLSSRERDH